MCRYIYTIFKSLPIYFILCNYFVIKILKTYLIFLNFSVDVKSDSLKSKKSELRLYCDLLMQQVHMVKTSANCESGPDLEKLNEATSLLTATCDTFIKTLEECMKMSNASLSYETHVHNTVNSTTANVNASSIKKISKQTLRSNSQDR